MVGQNQVQGQLENLSILASKRSIRNSLSLSELFHQRRRRKDNIRAWRAQRKYQNFQFLTEFQNFDNKWKYDQTTKPYKISPNPNIQKLSPKSKNVDQSKDCQTILRTFAQEGRAVQLLTFYHLRLLFWKSLSKGGVCGCAKLLTLMMQICWANSVYSSCVYTDI